MQKTLIEFLNPASKQSDLERLLYVNQRPFLCVNCKSTGLQSAVPRATLGNPKQGVIKNVDHAYCSSCKTLMVYGY